MPVSTSTTPIPFLQGGFAPRKSGRVAVAHPELSSHKDKLTHLNFPPLLLPKSCLEFHLCGPSYSLFQHFPNYHQNPGSSRWLGGEARNSSPEWLLLALLNTCLIPLLRFPCPSPDYRFTTWHLWHQSSQGTGLQERRGFPRRALSWMLFFGGFQSHSPVIILVQMEAGAAV